MSYSQYSELDELWLPVIPAHWNSRKIKYMFAERSEKGYPDEPLLVASQNMGVVPKGVYGNRTVEATKDLENLKLVRIGDFVISLRSFQGGLEYAYYQGIISPAYTVMIPNEHITSGYFKYLAKSRLFIELLQMCVTGIREGQNIDYSKLKNHYIPLPPRDEQDQIVRYLDWKVSGINRLINVKKKQIVLLQEQKRVIINGAVTRGGEGWKEHQLAKIATITLSGLDKKSYEGQMPVLLCNYVDVYKNENITSALNFMKATASEAEKASLKLHLDDVVITKDSESWDDIGVPAYVAEEIENLYCGYHLAIIRSSKKVLSGEYLAFAFRSQYIQIQHKVKAKGVTRFALGFQPIHDTLVLVPPLDEQHSIVQQIKTQCQTQDTCISNIKKQIASLDEYRTRLIADVVTGKLDVRDVVVPKYEAVEETAENEDFAGEEELTEEAGDV